MNTKTMEGKCLCGAVSIQANENKEVEACHCEMCRRWGGGPLMAIHCGSDVSITGAEYVSEFESSAWASRAFCKNCGTHLFYRYKPESQHIIPVGLFQNIDDWEFKEQVFIDKKPPFYGFSNKTENLTEKQVFEKYAGK